MDRPAILIRIDTRANAAGVNGQLLVRFTRRWEAALLALVLRAGRVGLNEVALQRGLAARGQGIRLNRAQLSRLFNNLAQFAREQAEDAFAIVHGPRQATVGPWWLEASVEIEWLIDGEPWQPVRIDDDWPYPGLTRDIDEAILWRTLQEVMLSDGFAAVGDWRAAREALRALDDLPLREEARALVALRRITCLRRLGEYAEALVELQRLRLQTITADPALPGYIEFLILRTQYDQGPAGYYEALWEATELPPALARDTRIQPEWHTLRALLLRRRLPAFGTRPELYELHREALRHFEAAIYFALWHADWTRLQAYVTNVGFYLQTWGSLTQWQKGVTPLAVLRWQGLTLAYADKFDAGRESAWECIFFAEFWLDHPLALERLSQRERNAQEVSGLLPNQEAFYQHAVRRLHAVADRRQLAIMLTLYLRFATHHMPYKSRPATIRHVWGRLLELFAGPDGEQIRLALAEEGYARWWPPGVAPE